MFLRKRSVILSIVVLTALSLVACSQSKSSGSGTDKQTAAANKSPEPSTKPVQLKFLGGTDNFNPQEDYTRTRIKDLLNVDIIPSMGTELDKVNLILSSGQDYDMINLPASDRNALGTWIRSGALQPLNDAIDKYGPNLKKAFPKEVWDMVSSDGKIYAIPTTNYSGVVDGIVIRQDWLKKLNLPVPTTPDEFYATLKAFKEKDPGGLGSKLIPFAMSGADTNIELNSVAQAFGIGSNVNSIIEKDGALVDSLEQPGAKDYISFLNKLYAEGLLDPDFPITKKDKLIEKLGAGTVGAAYLQPWDSAALKALQAADPNANLIYLPPFKDKDGKQRVQTTAGLYQFVIVPKVSKNVDAVIKYANDFLDPKNYTKLILGDEGVTYKVEGGKYYPIFPAFDKLNKGRWFYPVNEEKMYTPLFAARARKEKEMGSLYDDVNTTSGPFGYANIVNFAPMMPSVEKYGNQLDVMLKDRLIKMVIDAKELNNFDATVKEWKDKGGDAIMTDYNNWYKTRAK